MWTTSAPCQIAERFFKIPANTVIRVRTIENVSSQASRVGDVVPMEVLSDVIVNGFVVVRQGAPAVGEVSRVKEARSMGRRGNVALTLSYVEAVTGEHLLVGGNRAEKGKGKAAKLTAEIAVTTAVTGGIVGALWLFEKGHDTEIPPGTTFAIYTAGDTTIDLSLLRNPLSTSLPPSMSANTASSPTAESILPRPMPSSSMVVPDLGVVVKTRVNMGAEVISVLRGGPAEKVGIKVGNVISEIDGKRVSSVRDLDALLANREPGSTIRLSWLFRSNLGWMPTPDHVVTLARAQE